MPSTATELGTPTLLNSTLMWLASSAADVTDASVVVTCIRSVPAGQNEPSLFISVHTVPAMPACAMRKR